MKSWVLARIARLPRLALLTRRHIAVVHFADLPTLHQASEHTGDRPLGDPGGLAHLGRTEPLCPRGGDGRQDLPLTTRWLGRRRGWGEPRPSPLANKGCPWRGFPRRLGGGGGA